MCFGSVFYSTYTFSSSNGSSLARPNSLCYSLVPLRFVSCLCCHPTYLKQVLLVPPARSNAALARQNPNHLPTHFTKYSRNNFAPSKHPVGWKGTCGALMCFARCSLALLASAIRSRGPWPGCVIGYGRGKFLGTLLSKQSRAKCWDVRHPRNDFTNWGEHRWN